MTARRADVFRVRQADNSRNPAVTRREVRHTNTSKPPAHLVGRDADVLEDEGAQEEGEVVGIWR